jgi:hypothetical protein
MPSIVHSLCTLSGLIPLTYGLLAFVRPAEILQSCFGLSYPSLPSDVATVDALMAIYGARDVFMGIAIIAAGMYRTRKVLGWIILALSGVAAVDGWVCVVAKTGAEWTHWGYAPVMAVFGAWLLVK